MKSLHRWLLLAALFIGAIVCYVAGSTQGAVVFILFGMVFEGLFWFKLIKTVNRKA
ncbi:MAG: hypothetical protein HRT35_35795 [Algicola sp.]|nr:hypothetical protein [Algicola sp.]